MIVEADSRFMHFHLGIVSVWSFTAVRPTDENYNQSLIGCYNNCNSKILDAVYFFSFYGYVEEPLECMRKVV